MMGTWPSVIATNPADPEAPARATLLADPFRKAVRALHASRMTSRCRQPKPSRMPRICSTVAWHSTRTRCSRRHGKTAQTMSGCCGKAWPNSLSASPTSSAATSRVQSPCSPGVGTTGPRRPPGTLRHRCRQFGRLRRCADRRPRGGRRDHTEASATPSGCRPTPIGMSRLLRPREELQHGGGDDPLMRRMTVTISSHATDLESSIR